MDLTAQELALHRVLELADEVHALVAGEQAREVRGRRGLVCGPGSFRAHGDSSPSVFANDCSRALAKSRRARAIGMLPEVLWECETSHVRRVRQDPCSAGRPPGGRRRGGARRAPGRRRVRARRSARGAVSPPLDHRWPARAGRQARRRPARGRRPPSSPRPRPHARGAARPALRGRRRAVAVRRNGPASIRKIGVGYVDDRAGRDVLDAARDVAWQLGADIHARTVVPPSHWESADSGVGKLAVAAGRRMAEIPGVHGAAVEGRPQYALADLSQDVDLLVVGSRHHGALRSLLHRRRRRRPLAQVALPAAGRAAPALTRRQQRPNHAEYARRQHRRMDDLLTAPTDVAAPVRAPLLAGISIVLPCFDEEDNVADAIRAAVRRGSRRRLGVRDRRRRRRQQRRDGRDRRRLRPPRPARPPDRPQRQPRLRRRAALGPERGDHALGPADGRGPPVRHARARRLRAARGFGRPDRRLARPAPGPAAPARERRGVELARARACSRCPSTTSTAPSS